MAEGYSKDIHRDDSEPTRFVPKVGMVCRTRDGRRVGPLTEGPNYETPLSGRFHENEPRILFHDDGRRLFSRNAPETDLVAEWKDEPDLAQHPDAQPVHPAIKAVEMLDSAMIAEWRAELGVKLDSEVLPAIKLLKADREELAWNNGERVDTPKPESFALTTEQIVRLELAKAVMFAGAAIDPSAAEWVITGVIQNRD